MTMDDDKLKAEADKPRMVAAKVLENGISRPRQKQQQQQTRKQGPSLSSGIAEPGDITVESDLQPDDGNTNGDLNTNDNDNSEVGPAVDDNSVAGEVTRLVQAQRVTDYDTSDDELDIEAKVNERIAAVDDEQIRQQILNDTTLEVVGNAVVVDVQGGDKSDQEERMKQRCRLYGMVGSGLVVLVIVILVVLSVFLRGRDGKSAGPDAVNRRRQELLVTILSPLYDQVDGNGNTAVFDNADMVGEKAIFVEDTPQHKALKWLSETDQFFNVSLLEEVVFSANEKQQLLRQVLLERYALTVLYFTTQGDDDVRGWHDQLGFLDANKPVCAWNDIGAHIANRNDPNVPNDDVLEWDDDRFVAVDDDPGNTVRGVVTCDGYVGEWYSHNTISMLSLYSNNINGTLPWELSLLTSMKSFSLWDEPELRGTIPALFFERLTMMADLQIGYCGFTGSLPNDSISKLSNLEWFSILDTFVTGPIPENLIKLPNLRVWNMGTNLLTGPIPDIFDPSVDIGVDLQSVSLGRNLLTGTIPKSITRLASTEKLESFNVRDNELVGTIPTEFGLFVDDLKYIFLLGNLLTGPIPSEIGLIEDLEQLRIENNMLTSTIPFEIGQLRNLVLLALNDNKLTGSISEDVFSRLSENLISLDLHANMLSGPLPTTISVLPRLVILDIHNNSLTGDLDGLLCSGQNTGNSDKIWDLDEIRADCGVVSTIRDGQLSLFAELTCSCCSECCDDMSGCPYDTGIDACQRDLEYYNSPSVIECGCYDPSNQAEYPYPVPSYLDVDTVLSCAPAYFQKCNVLEKDCVISFSNYFYDEEGNDSGYGNHYLFVETPSTPTAYVGYSVHYWYSYVTWDCEVYVNTTAEFQKCRYCGTIGCADGTTQPIVLCDNVGGDEFDFNINGCYDGDHNTEALGFLQPILSQSAIEYTESYVSVETSKIYPPLYCQRDSQLQQNTVPELECLCSKDGISGSCELTAGCHFCSSNTSGDNDKENLYDCFNFDYSTEYTYNRGLNGYPDFKARSEVKYLASTNSSTNNVGFGNVNVTVDIIDSSDLSCLVHIEEEKCESCTISLCDDRIHIGYQVNCENHPIYPTYFDGCNVTASLGNVLQVLIPLDHTNYPFTLSCGND